MKTPLLRLALLAALPLTQLAHAASPQDDPPQPEPGTIELFVVDEDGEGIFKASAHVVLTEEERAEKLAESSTGGYLIDSVTSDPDGFLTLSLPAGERRTIRVDKGRDARRTLLEVEPLAPGETRELEVTLITKPDLDVKSRVVDATTREPLAGVEVHLSAHGGVRFGGPSKPLEVDHSPDAVTGPDGTFELRVRSWRNGTITMVAPGRSPLIGILAPHGAARPLDPPFVMKKAGALHGVVEQSSGDLPSRLTVVVEVRGYSLAQDDQRGTGTFNDAAFFAVVDEEGSFRLDDLPAGVPLSLRVERGREVLLREAVDRTLVAGEVTTASLLLGAGKRVHGRVLETDGAGAAGVEVWLRRSSGRMAGMMNSYPKPDERAVTDADGRYAFEDVQQGEWEVGLAPRSARNRLAATEQYAPIGQGVEVGVDGVEQDFVLHRGIFIEGTVLTPSGDPFPGAGASVFATNGGMWVGNIMVRDGAFRAGPLVPGEWKLNANCWGQNAEQLTYAPPESVIVETGGDPPVLQFQPGCGMTVRAVDPDSGETVDAIYSLFGREASSMQMSGSARETSELGNLKPGRYMVVMRTPDGRFGHRSFELVAGDLLEDEVIELGLGGSVQVRCEGSSKSVQVEMLLDGQRVAYTSMPSGQEGTLHGPVGEVTLVFREGGSPGASGDAKEVTRDIELTEGSTARVDVTIE